MEAIIVKFVVGQLVDPYVIKTETETIPVKKFSVNAMWRWFRLHYGHKLDGILRGHNIREMYELYFAKTDQRILQFAISDEGYCKMIASTKHLIIYPKAILEIAKRFLPYPYLYSVLNKGYIFKIGEDDLMANHIEVYLGDLYTRRAIRLGFYGIMHDCFNPLAWAQISALKRFKMRTRFTRLLRIKVKSDLEDRFATAVKSLMELKDDWKIQIDKSRSLYVYWDKAMTINKAFCISRKIGLRVIKQIEDVAEEFKIIEDTQPLISLYYLAWSQSYIARWGDFKKTPENKEPHAQYSLATISAATIMIEEPEITFKHAKEFLQKQRIPI